jgi:SAM-dependent methyltransferase
MNTKFFLPGTDKQLNVLLKQIKIKDLSILIIGPGTEEISKRFLYGGASKVVIIVQDNDSILRTRINLSGEKEIQIRLMEFGNTDFRNSTFDLVYAQASISTPNRNKILKEIRRILKPGGYLCAGEIVSLTQSPPQFVKDIWNNSGISPLFFNEVEKFYAESKFNVITVNDISYTLKEFYRLSGNLLKEKLNDLHDEEKIYYKKLLKQISHESNVYLKLGGNAHMGFIGVIVKKEEQ